MTTWQKLMIVLGVGGVATYALWRLWPKSGGAPPDLEYAPLEFDLLAERPISNPSEMGMPTPNDARTQPLMNTASSRALNACPKNTVWYQGQCVPVE